MERRNFIKSASLGGLFGFIPYKEFLKPQDSDNFHSILKNETIHFDSFSLYCFNFYKNKNCIYSIHNTTVPKYYPGEVLLKYNFNEIYKSDDGVWSILVSDIRESKTIIDLSNRKLDLDKYFSMKPAIYALYSFDTLNIRVPQLQHLFAEYNLDSVEKIKNIIKLNGRVRLNMLIENIK